MAPLLRKTYNFWKQLCSAEYYTDCKGNACYKKGKSCLENGEKYLIIPSFSPENKPLGYKSAITANAAMDIAAAKDIVRMYIDMESGLKEKGYIPTNPNTHTIKSGAVSYKAGRYYVSVLVDEQEQQKPVLNEFGIGIDLGLKDFAICSNGKTYKNINKSSQIRKLEKKLRREQRSLSRKYESYKKLNKNLKGEATRQNIQKQKLKVQKLYQRLDNIRIDYVNKVISELVKTKPMWITIEDLNVSGMMKNRHLSKTIAQQKFFEFRTKLLAKCNEYGIELRVVDRFYPSSKTCHCCGSVKSDLKLSDRTYHCNECGYTEDRDYNASLNLRDCQTYSIA